ncbi:MAG: radical SAM protein, partial [Desulfobulbaceae bacterium]|nr:radical SAM protein [Desulfobulbaceae bacterium]
RYLEAICTPYYPGRVTLQSFKTAHSHLSSFEILAAAEDSATNPFIRFIEQEVAHRYRRQAPEVAAISVTFQTQLIPAFTLARYIKQWLPGTRVVMGGAALARTHVPLTNTPHLFRDVDAVVLYEGETAFPALLEEWEQGKDGLDAPNVILPGTERMRQAKMRHIESLATLSAPDHAGLLLRDYWWPEPALLYNCARGCYWGRCAFCQISPATIGEGRGNYRLRPIEMIISDLDTMQRQTGAMSFNLAVDALPPRALQEIGSAIKQSGLNLTWDTEIRLENGLDRSVLRAMSEGGCRHVRFGFESASQRVLDLMNKGTTVENTRRILDDCRAAGITVSLMCQSGFPGETYAESLETVNFLKQEKDKVAFLSMVPYVLESGSDVFREPERFGIVVHENPPHEDLSWMYNYDGPDGRGVVENYAFFEKVEQSLDDSFPDRDLFFKGGLGHAHTSLYVRRYPFETFISWNERPCRVPGAFSEDKLLRTSSFMVITQNSGNRGTSGWSRFTLAVLETPEYLFTVDGSALLVLASCTTPRPARLIADWIRRLSWWVFSREESLAIVREFYENGLFLAAREQTGTMAP